jgi:hypothetical protein
MTLVHVESGLVDNGRSDPSSGSTRFGPPEAGKGSGFANDSVKTVKTVKMAKSGFMV